MYDLANNVKAVTAIEPKASFGAANLTGDSIDRNGYESVAFVVNVGTSGDALAAGLKLDFTMQHADDNGSGAPGTFAAVSAAAVIKPGQSPLVDGDAPSGVVLTIDDLAEDDLCYVVGYRGNKRWVRLNCAKTGTHTVGIPCGAVALLGHPTRSPVA